MNSHRAAEAKGFICALTIGSVVLLSSAAVGQVALTPAVKKSPVESPKRVLFLGNSLVYYNGALQTHTHRIAAAGEPHDGGRLVVVQAALFEGHRD